MQNLDDALYEIQILEAAVADRDKKIKELRNTLISIDISLNEIRSIKQRISEVLHDT